MRIATISTLLLASASTMVQAAEKMNLFAAAGNGQVYTVAYDPAGNSGSGSMSIIQNNTGCGLNPTWLYKGLNKNRVWCWEEGSAEKAGSINRLDIGQDGKLTRHLTNPVAGNPVQGGLCLEDRYFCSAVYGGIDGPSTRGGLQMNPVFNGELIGGRILLKPQDLTAPGPGKSQTVPRGHGVVTDPTNRYVVMPDLGSDSLMIVKREGTNDTHADTIPMAKGTGPRHGVFYSPAPLNNTLVDPEGWFFYVVGEISNTITTYNVSYLDGTMKLVGPSRVISTFAGSKWENNTAVQTNAKAAEIKVGPGSPFISVSNRLVSTNGTGQESLDSITTFAVNADGSLAPVDYVELGLKNPRAFEFNPSGDRVLVSSTTDSKIAVYYRDRKTGKISPDGAMLDIWTGEDKAADPGVNHAIWDFR